jgi:hypothetical protein
MVLLGQGNSVSTPTRYGLDGLTIESRWGDIFRTCPDGPGTHQAGSLFSGVKRPGRVVNSLHTSSAFL